MTDPLPPEQEFNTWVEIAGYLSISVREAQYREKSEGLPVRRLEGKKPRVWALRSDLDQWRLRPRSEKHPAAVVFTDSQKIDDEPAAPATTENPRSSRRPVSRRWILAGIAGSAITVGSAGLLLKSCQPPERAVLTGNLLTAVNGLGRTLWTYRFSGILQQFSDDEMRWRVQMVDLNGDGHPGVVVACSFLPESSTNVSARDELSYFSPDGTLRWTLPCQPDLLDYDGRPFEPAWQYSHVLASPTQKGQVLFVSIKHQFRWPGCVERVDGAGRRRVQFANAGNIESLCRLPRPDGDYLVVSGENNAFDRACVSFIGVDDPPSCSPEGGPARYRYVTVPAGAPRAYFLLPTVELTLANGASYGHAKRVSYRGDGVIVDVDVVGPNTSLLYEFSDRPEPRLVMPSGNYPVTHEQFEKQGSLHHSWQACPELTKPLTLRRWRPGIGWRDQDIPWRLPNNLA